MVIPIIRPVFVLFTTERDSNNQKHGVTKIGQHLLTGLGFSFPVKNRIHAVIIL